MAKIEWYWNSPGQGETVEMEFSSAEEFYTERRRALIELGVRRDVESEPKVTTVIVPKVVANVRV